MDGNLKDILSHLSTEVDQETLLLYLQGKLPPEKQHEVEQHILNNEFASDALEGLRGFKDPAQLDHLVAQLNQELRKKTARKKKSNREAGAEPWLVIALIIILVLIVVSYLIIHQQLKES
jgi:hypothetical protein